MNLRDIAISNIKGSDRCIISLISKNGAINLLQNADLTGKKRNIVKLKNIKILKAYIKMKEKI